MELKKQDLVSRIRTAISKKFPEEDIELYTFGSSRNLLWLDGSDIDVVIVFYERMQTS
jgi:DNA polymerase sigma